MTARTSQKLADALRSAKLEELALRAEKDEFHDFLADDALASITLSNELHAIAHDASGKYTEAQRIAAINIRARHHNGEFDADTAESEEWAASEEGQDTFRRLIKGE